MREHEHQTTILIFDLYSWIALDTPPSCDTDADTSGKENTQVLYRRPKCPSMFDVFLLDLSNCSIIVKVKKAAKIRNRYNQVPQVLLSKNWFSRALIA